MKAYKDFFYDKDVSYTDKEERLYAKESLVFNVSEDLLLFLEDHNISKKELAKRLGKTKAYVTQLLNGSRNMTLGSFSDICFALGFKPEIKIPSKDSIQSDFLFKNAWISLENLNDELTIHNPIRKVKKDNVLTPDVPGWTRNKAA